MGTVPPCSRSLASGPPTQWQSSAIPATAVSPVRQPQVPLWLEEIAGRNIQTGTNILIVFELVIFCGFSFHVLNLLLLLSNYKLLKQQVLARMLLVNQARWPTGGWPERLTGVWWPSRARTVVGELDDNLILLSRLHNISRFQIHGWFGYSGC